VRSKAVGRGIVCMEWPHGEERSVSSLWLVSYGLWRAKYGIKGEVAMLERLTVQSLDRTDCSLWYLYDLVTGDAVVSWRLHEEALALSVV
jgi:hypothetical protein